MAKQWDSGIHDQQVDKVQEAVTFNGTFDAAPDVFVTSYSGVTKGTGANNITTTGFDCYSEATGNTGWLARETGFDEGSSSSSSSSLSSSSSSSSSSLSSSSSSLSSSSLSSSCVPGTVTYGHYNEPIDEDYNFTFLNNWSTNNGWTITPGLSGTETISTSAGCGACTILDPHCLGTMEAVVDIDKYLTGYSPYPPEIEYRTSTTELGLSGSWVPYNGVSFTSLGWVQLRVCYVSSSSVSSSSTSSSSSSISSSSVSSSSTSSSSLSSSTSNVGFRITEELDLRITESGVKRIIESSSSQSSSSSISSSSSSSLSSSSISSSSVSSSSSESIDFHEILDDTWWKNDTLPVNWIPSAGEWTSTTHLLQLTPVTSGPNVGWQLGFRPEAVKMTLTSDRTSGVMNMFLQDDDFDHLFDSNNLPIGTTTVSGDVIFIDESDIFLINFGGGPFEPTKTSISDIQFLYYLHSSSSSMSSSSVSSSSSSVSSSSVSSSSSSLSSSSSSSSLSSSSSSLSFSSSSLSFSTSAGFIEDYFDVDGLNTNLWREQVSGTASVTVTGGVLILNSNFGTLGDPPTDLDGIYQKGISGDFDIKLKITDYGTIDGPAGISFGVDDNNFAAVGKIINNNTAGWYSKGDEGEGGGSVGYTLKPAYFRMARVGSVVTMYTGTDANDSWTSRASRTLGSGDGRIYILCNDDGTDFTADFDWILLNATSVSSSSTSSSSSST